MLSTIRPFVLASLASLVTIPTASARAPKVQASSVARTASAPRAPRAGSRSARPRPGAAARQIRACDEPGIVCEIPTNFRPLPNRVRNIEAQIPNALRNGDAHESTAFFELPEGSEGISDGPFGTHSSSTGHVQSIVRFPNAPDHIALTISDSRKLGDGYYQSQLVIVRFAGSGSGRLRSEGTMVTRIVFDDFGGVGNYNHVAGMDIIGDILVVTGQNWSGLKSPRGQDSDNAALFFDVADPKRPKFLGKVTPTSGLGNGLDTVAITRAFDPTSKTHRYFLGMAHMNSGHASEVFSSSTMDPHDFVPYDLSPAGDFSAGFNQNTHWVVDTSGRPWGIEMSKDGGKGKVNFRKLFFRGTNDVTDGDATTAIDDDDCDWRDSAGSFVDSSGNISFLATKGHFSSDGNGGYALRICEHRQ